MEALDSPETIFTLCIFGGPVIGLIWVYGAGAFLTVAGRWVGGIGSYREVRSALGWAYVPVIWSGLLWTVEYLAFGRNFFMLDFPAQQAQVTVEAVGYLLILADAAIGLWAFVILVNCLAEAHRLPLVKAFWTWVILLAGFAALLAAAACVL